MSHTGLLQIQRALYTYLNGDAALSARVTGVFDEVLQDQPLPYVAIGDATETRFNTFGRQGKDCTVTIHVWSEYEGFREVLEITDIIVKLLDGYEMPVQGFDLVYIRFEDTNTLREGDGMTRHVVVRFRIIVQEHHEHVHLDSTVEASGTAVASLTIAG